VSFLRPRIAVPILLALFAGVSLAIADCELPPNDEGALLVNAARILRGAVFYRDLDAYPFPAPTYLLAGAMRLFGEDVAVARALAALCYGGVGLGVYACALSLTTPARAACVGLWALGCKGFAWPAFSSYFYSDVALLGGVSATAALLRHERSPHPIWLVLAGFACALAIFSKQSLGLLLAPLLVAALLARARSRPELARRLRPAAGFALWTALPCALALAYFAAQGVAGRMLWSGLVRPFTGYLPTSSIAFLPMLAWWELGSLRGMDAFPYIGAPLWILIAKAQFASEAVEKACWLGAELASRAVYLALPLILGFALRAFVRRWREPVSAAGDARAGLPVGALALAAAASAFPRADFFHVISVFPALVLLAHAQRGARAVSRGEAALALGAALSGVVLLGAFAQRLDHRVELERARLWVGSDSQWAGPLVEELRASVPAGEPVFVYGNEATLYFLADRYFPWPFPQLYPGQEGGDGGRALAELLRRERPRLVVRGITSWPGLPALPSYTPALVAELRRGWEPDATAFARGLLPGEPGQTPLIALLRRRAGLEAR
jgi:4-amino-4-deoxy-L-arabinose transferase-like glycosyltransferase